MAGGLCPSLVFLGPLGSRGGRRLERILCTNALPLRAARAGRCAGGAAVAAARHAALLLSVSTPSDFPALLPRAACI